MLNLTDRGYFEELKDLGKKLQDFIAHFEKGEVSYYKDIAIKLRILYLFKSKAKPLLKTVSEIFGFKVKVFINYTISERIEKGLIPEDIGRGLLNSLVIEINNNTANWFTKGKDLIDIFDALDRKEIFIGGKHYSYKEIIEYAADKMGGAHVDKHHDETHISMHLSDGFHIGGLPIAQRAILDTGRESITLINHIIDFIENGEESTFVYDSLETIEDVQQFLDNTTGSPSFSRRGYLRAKHGDFAGAITEYTKAIELDSQDFAAYSNRGISKYELEDFEGARKDFDEAIRLNPKYADAYNSRGTLRYKQRELERAGEDFEEAIKLAPYWFIPYFNRGNVKYVQSDFEGALKDYDKAIELNPDCFNAYFIRGVLKSNQGDWEGALKDYDKAIELNPNYAEPYNNRGNIRNEQGDLKGAMTDYDKAIELNQKHVDYYSNRGISKFKQGDLDGAMADYDKAIELNPNHANAYFNKAELLEKMGKIPEAIECGKEYIRLKPDDPQGPELLAELEKKLKG